MSIFNKFSNLFIQPNQEPIIIEDEDESPYPFGTILYQNEDKTEDIVSIDDPILFCENIKVWTGCVDTKYKEDENCLL